MNNLKRNQKRISRHKNARAVHTIRRIEKRYGMRLTYGELERIKKDIKKGKAECLGKADSGLIYKVVVRNQELKLIYSKTSDSIVTALSKE